MLSIVVSSVAGLLDFGALPSWPFLLLVGVVGSSGFAFLVLLPRDSERLYVGDNELVLRSGILRRVFRREDVVRVEIEQGADPTSWTLVIHGHRGVVRVRHLRDRDAALLILAPWSQPYR